MIDIPLHCPKCGMLPTPTYCMPQNYMFLACCEIGSSYFSISNEDELPYVESWNEAVKDYESRNISMPLSNTTLPNKDISFNQASRLVTSTMRELRKLTQRPINDIDFSQVKELADDLIKECEYMNSLYNDNKKSI